jgi:hypothetical protein
MARGVVSQRLAYQLFCAPALIQKLCREVTNPEHCRSGMPAKAGPESMNTALEIVLPGSFTGHLYFADGPIPALGLPS